jgi:hypothetical protein
MPYYLSDLHPEILTEEQFFADINYSEPVEYVVPVPSEDKIKQFLIDRTIDISCYLNSPLIQRKPDNPQRFSLNQFVLLRPFKI